jgi:hypothetical protein
MSDPVRRFEHSHTAITRLVEEVARLVRAPPSRRPQDRELLGDRLQLLRDELLQHFAAEEEGLFPFLRSNLPAMSEVVDGLASAHDVICGAVVRMGHLADDDRGAAEEALLGQFARFERAYVEHSRGEATLLEELARTLDNGHKEQLTEVLRGL